MSHACCGTFWLPLGLDHVLNSHGLGQEVRLHGAVSPHSEALANAMYQQSTLLYVLDALLEARAVCQQSLDICTQLYKPGDDHVSPDRQSYVGD